MGLFNIWKLSEVRGLPPKTGRGVAFHGTRSKNLDHLRRYGLVPGARSAYTDAYSKYDDGRHLFFTDNEDLARHYGDLILRFPWPSEAKPDVNEFGRYLPGQFVSLRKIPPDEIDVLHEGTWEPLVGGLSKQACIIVGKDFDGHLCLLKNRDRSYDVKLQIMHMEFNGVEMAFVLDLETGYLEGVNEHGIGVVNTTLMVLHDEAEGHSTKTKGKTTLKSKDGPKIFHALIQDNLQDAVDVLVSFRGGIRGHTFVADGQTLLSIECTRKNPARVHHLDPGRVNTRTNHGVSYPEAGYTRGEDYVSSIVRRWEAQKRIQGVKRPEAAAPALATLIDEADSPFNPVRVTDKMRTTSQLLIDTSTPSLYLYLIPGHARVTKILNLLPGGRAPKIPVRVFRYRKRMEDRDFEDDGHEMKDEVADPGGDLLEKRTARYKDKKTVKTKDGDERVIYEYGPRQVLNRNKAKAERIENLRKQMSALRRKVKKDLESSDDQKRAVALAVALMDETYERPGNEASASEGHYGVTTWQNRHVKFRNGKATITYVGKSGVEHKKVVETPAVVKALKMLCKGRGKDDRLIDVEAADVNEFLRSFEITAKDIRGFHANREMKDRLKRIRREGPDLPRPLKDRDKILKEEFKQALAETAEAVGHTESTLRSQYLVPGLEDEYMKDGTVSDSHVKSGGAALLGAPGVQERPEGALRVAATRGTPTERRILANALLAPVLVVRDRRWWLDEAPSLYRLARDHERPRPVIDGLRFDPDLFAMLWYEDEDGNRLPEPPIGDLAIPEDSHTQHSRFPNVLRHTILLLNDDGTSSSLAAGESSFPSDLVTQMVRSGDWDTADAIMVAGQACERCLNVLLHHYGIGDGYPFGSEDYWRANTDCSMCEDIGRRMATKSPAEKEDENVEKMLRPEPKKKPPRYDLRNNRTLEDRDEDLEGMGAGDRGDRDLSLKWNKVAHRVAFRWLAVPLAPAPLRVAMRRIARQFPSEFQDEVAHQRFTHPETRNSVGFGSLPSEEQSKIYKRWKSKAREDKAPPEDAEKSEKGKEDDVERELDEARDRVDSLEDKVDKAKDQIKESRENIKGIKNLLEKAGETARGQLEGKLREEVSKMRKAEDALEEVTDELEAARKRVDQLKAERKAPTSREDKRREDEEKRRKERAEETLDEVRDAVRGMVSKDSDIPEDVRAQIETAFANLSEEQVEDFSEAFQKSLGKLVRTDASSEEAANLANASVRADLSEIEDPAELARTVAEVAYARNVVTNPLVVGGKPLGQTKMDDAGYSGRAMESFRQFQRLSPALRESAAEKIAEELRGLDEDSDKAQELQAILTGINTAHIADTGHALPGRPQPNKGAAALIRRMVENGQAETMFKPVEDFFADDSRAAMQKALSEMDDAEVADFVIGDDGDHPFGKLREAMQEKGASEYKQLIKDFLIQDFMSDIWGDRAVRDYMESAGFADFDNPEARAQLLRDTRYATAPEADMQAIARAQAAIAAGQKPDPEDEERARNFLDPETGGGIRGKLRKLMEILQSKVKKRVVTPATAVINHFLETGEAEVLHQETLPHPDEGRGGDTEAKEDEGHGLGDVWKTDEGNWRAKNLDGVPKTFDTREKAQAYAKGGKDRRKPSRGSEAPGEEFSAEFTVPVEERGPTRFANHVANAWLAQVRKCHPDDPGRPRVVFDTA